jgi:hypothetical protein
MCRLKKKKNMMKRKKKKVKMSRWKLLLKTLKIKRSVKLINQSLYINLKKKSKPQRIQ